MRGPAQVTSVVEIRGVVAQYSSKHNRWRARDPLSRVEGHVTGSI